MLINVKDEFITLAKINSPSKKEGNLAKYLKNRLRELGAEVSEDNSSVLTGSDTGNIIATYPGNLAKPTILLAAHMDTIIDTEGMIPQEKDGIIYSDGKTVLGADDKAGIAVILGVMDILKHQSVEFNHGPVEVLFTVQEEVGLIGAKYLDFPLKSEYGYVLDSDGPVGALINSSPYHIILDLIVEGKAAHAGVAPETGINAIVVASKAIAAIESGRIDEETTSNFGIITGGKGRNIVPDRVEIKAEVRSRDKEKLERETQKIVRKFEEVTTQHRAGFSYHKELAYEALKLSPGHPAITGAYKAGEKLGIDVSLHATGGGMDSNILSTKGVPCVTLSVGYANAHTNEEYVKIDEMERAVQFVLAILDEV